MKSMTGFGVGEAQTPAGRLVVEVRAVNHRFLDVRVRAPRELGDLVAYAEQLGRERLARGRVEVAIRLEASGGQAVSLDVDRARGAYTALCALRDELAPGSEVPLSLLAAVPDLFAPATEKERETMRTSCKEAFDRAVQALERMRVGEGRALADDLRTRLASVRRSADSIAARAPQVVDLTQKRLKARLQRLLGSEVPLDAGRLEQEIALLADRSDVTEELTRLSSHCTQFEALFDSSEACGRRLDFLLQEMVREVNTIGSKAQDAEVAHLVVEAKSELERMREQVQNVE
ncbi:MAG: YicC/YloC family endoribonuclease [Polyangiales bacterium]